jgi:diguanylate cyclase (GGDEF)-like protein
METDRSYIDIVNDAIEAAGDAIYDWDLTTGAIEWLGNAREVLGIQDCAEVSQAERYLSRVTPACIGELRRTHTERAQTGARFTCSYEIRRGDRSTVWVEDRGRFFCSPEGEPLRIMGTLRCLDQSSRPSEWQNCKSVNFDDLTGQYNRGRLRESLDHAIEYALRYDSTGAFLQLGIDNLPLIHDTYGRDVAEQTLISVSRELDRSLRASDSIGRVAHDQFGIVLSGCSSADVSTAAEKLLHAVQESAVLTDKGHIPVTASVGAVSFPDIVRTSYDAMAKADISLEKARRAGANSFSLYNLSAEQMADLRDNLAAAGLVQTALRNRSFQLYFQPIVDAEKFEPKFYECLLRMFDQDGELLAAGKFLPIAEKMGLIRSIDRFALDATIEELIESPDARFALNISSLSTTDPSWLRALTAKVKKHEHIAHRLLVEITETTALHDMRETTKFIAALKEMGCRVALDDFGAGYTSFRHLQELSIDIVKIDGSFVKSIGDNTNSQLFIETLQSFASGLGLETVAECVESARVAELLQRYGVTYMQGYHFGAPSANRPWNPKAPRLRVVPKDATAAQFGALDQGRPELPAGGKVISLVTRH